MKIINFKNPNLRYIEGEGGDAGGGVPTDNSGAEPVDNQGGGQEPTGTNPAWNEVLEKIPSQLHPMVTPYFDKWDKNFQTQLQQVQSPFEPYKPFVEAGVEPEMLQAALNFYQMAEQDPQRVFEEMAKYYGFGQDQGQQEQVPDSDELNLDGEDDPRFTQLAQNQEAIAQMLLQQHQKEQEAQYEAQVEQEVSAIKEAHPDMSEQDEVQMYRIAIANGSSLTDAAAELFSYKESIATSAMQNRPQAPAVMSATGTIPGQAPIDPRKLDSKGTKDLVRSILENRQ